jgi:hypothetical protein
LLNIKDHRTIFGKALQFDLLCTGVHPNAVVRVKQSPGDVNRDGNPPATGVVMLALNGEEPLLGEDGGARVQVKLHVDDGISGLKSPSVHHGLDVQGGIERSVLVPLDCEVVPKIILRGGLVLASNKHDFEDDKIISSNFLSYLQFAQV